VTDHTVRSFREIFAALDDVGFGEVGWDASRIGLLIVGKRNCRAAGKCERPWIEGTPGEHADGHDDDSGDNGGVWRNQNPPISFLNQRSF
jgi:hypothetical protein